MSHLLKITADREVEAIQWNGHEDSLTQLYRALSTDAIAVDMIQPAPHSRGEHITLWADEDGMAHNARLNLYASAYAGTPLLGTVAISAFNSRTGDTTGLTEEQFREEEDYLIKAIARTVARLGALNPLANA